MATEAKPEGTEAAAAADGAAGGDAATDEAGKAAAAAAAEGGDQQQGADGADGDQQNPEQTPEEKAAAEKQATEWEVKVKAAAEKYAKEQIALANRTMAAARRTQAAVEEVKTQNQALRKENEVYGGFVEQLRTQPLAALGRLGFRTVKEFIDHCIASGGDAKEPTEEEKIANAVKKALEEREAPRKKADQEAAVKESQAAVFAFVDENKEKYARTATRTGKKELWDAITTYFEKHGDCPDEAVTFLCDKVEAELRADLGDPVSPRPGDKKGNPAAKGAAPAASSSGESLAGKPMSGAPAAKKYSDDPDERRAQINAELRQEGVL